MTDRIGRIKAALAAKKATQDAATNALRQRYEEQPEFPQAPDAWVNTQQTIRAVIEVLNSEFAGTGVHFVLSVAQKQPAGLSDEYVGRGHITATTEVGTRAIVLAVHQNGFIEITWNRQPLDQNSPRGYEMNKTDAGAWRDILLGVLDQIATPAAPRLTMVANASPHRHPPIEGVGAR